MKRFKIRQIENHIKTYAEAVDSLPANFVDVCSKPADLESLAAVFDGTIFSAGHPVVSLVAYRTFDQHTAIETR